MINLRDTWTAGPVLTVFERVLGELDRARTGSRVESLFETTTTALRVSPIRVIGILMTTLTVATMLTSDTMTRVIIGLAVLLVGVIATRDDRNWQPLRETQLAVVLRRVLEPPSLPANAENDDSVENSATDEDHSTDTDDSK